MPASKFTIYREDKFNGDSSLDVDLPERLAQPGDIYVVMKAFRALSGHRYPNGSVLEIVARTQSSPHGFSSSLGNCIVRDEFFTSVWSSIDMMIEEGIVELAYNK